MKTLEEIKNEVAKENGYKDWNDLHEYYVEINSPFNIILDAVAKRYAELACEVLRGRIAEAAKVNFDCNVWNCEGQSVNKDSIRNVEIILP